MVWGDTLWRRFSVRSSRALWRYDSASTTPISPTTSRTATRVLTP